MEPPVSGPPTANAAAPAAALESGLKALGLARELAPPLLAYLAELGKWNAAYNLTAVRDPRAMVTRHLLDSLVVLPHVGQGTLIDVGAGAGLPGLVLAIARPALQVTLLDSNGKKARFLRHAQRTLKLDNVEVAEARVEDWRPLHPYGQVISRAFASLGEFLRLSAQLAAADGRWLAMKGKVSAEELESIPPGMSLEAVHPLAVPGLREARSLVVVRRA